MAKLYELTTDLKSILSDDFDEQTLKDTLEAVGGEFNDKAVSIIKLAENLSGDTSVIDAEIKRLQARKSAIANKQKQLREYLIYNMQESGITKVECPLFTASLRKGVEKVVIDNEMLIPDEYAQIEVVTKVNKAEIKKQLRSGVEIPGARLERGETTLLIK